MTAYNEEFGTQRSLTKN